MNFALVIAVALAAVDAVVTNEALERGLVEANPILRKALGARPPLWSALAWRGAVLGALTWAHLPTPGWWALSGILLGAIVWNLRKMAGVRR